MKNGNLTNKNAGTYRRRDEFRQGQRDGVPIALGYFAVCFTFGMAAAQDGVGAGYAALMSAMCTSSAGQFAGLSVITAGGGFLELALTQFVINLRYLLMSFSLSAKLGRSVGSAPRFLVAHGVTDEIFAISMLRKPLTPWYTWGAMSVAQPGWILGALIGGILGDLLPGFLLSALSVAIYGMFLAIILPPARSDRAILAVVLVAMALRAVLTWTPRLSAISSGFAIIIVTVAAAALAAIFFPRAESASDCDADPKESPSADMRPPA